MHLPKVHYVLKFADNIFRHLIDFSAQAKAATSHVRRHHRDFETQKPLPSWVFVRFFDTPAWDRKKEHGLSSFLFSEIPASRQTTMQSRRSNV
jgi:hypothetical protein